MELDPRIKEFRVEFPLNKTTSGLKPSRTYHGRILVKVTEPVAVSQLQLLFEGWEHVDFGVKIGSSRKLLFRSTENLLQTNGIVTDTIVRNVVFDFSCTMPNVNFPSAMWSAICEVAYTLSATLVGSASSPLARQGIAGSAGRSMTLAASSVPVQLAPKVLPSGVGWLKPLVLRDGIMLLEPVRRRFRRQTVQTAMNIYVQVKNHCCTLGESISVDVDATMLQHNRVLTFIRASVIEQVALKTHVQDATALESINAFLSNQGPVNTPTVILAERTLNRKVTEVDPSALINLPAARTRDSSSSSLPLPRLNGVQSLHIRVPRSDVCTAEGFFLSFTHVLRLNFGLTSRSSSGQLDTKHVTKDIPLRIVTSKFGDVGSASQVEINKRLSALTTESDSYAVSAAYGYLLSENSRVPRPESLEPYAGCRGVPAPRLEAVVYPTVQPCMPMRESTELTESDAPALTLTPTTITPNMITTLRTPEVRQRSDSGFSININPDPVVSSRDSCILPLTPIPAPRTLMETQMQRHITNMGFQFGPLPPVPQEISADGPADAASSHSKHDQPDLTVRNIVDATEHIPLPLLVSEDKQEQTRNASCPGSPALYTVNRHSIEDSDDSRSWHNRDTLVDIISAASPRSGSLPASRMASPNAASGDYAFISTKGYRPHVHGQNMSTAAASPEIPFIGYPSKAMSLNEKRMGRQTFSDKRDSSRSEGETVVYSPRSDKCDMDDYPLDGISTKSNSPQLKLPKLPVLPAIESLAESLDNMAKGMLTISSPTPDKYGFSSYWNA
ncbi:hypothetical protein GGF37_000029 [Kickxella alabastrina]|nr:hypothetical protein GGF37_000029 [Kickxella alabastrina]